MNKRTTNKRTSTNKPRVSTNNSRTKKPVNNSKVTMSRAAYAKLQERLNDYSKEKSEIRKFAGAEVSQYRQDWTSVETTTYQEIAESLKSLIYRSKQLANDNPYAQSILNIYDSNVICEGIKPVPKLTLPKNIDPDSKKSLELRELLMPLWNRFVTEFDRSGKQDYYEAQKMILRSTAISGGAFINMVKSKSGSLLPIAFQIIDQSALNSTKDTVFREGSTDNQILHGIEYDQWLSPISYNFYGGLGLKGVNVKADNCRHVYKRVIADQLVGIPWLSGCMTGLYDIDNLINNVLLSSIIQSSVGIWLQKDDEYFPNKQPEVDDNGDPIVIDPDEPDITLDGVQIWRTKNKPELLSIADSTSKVAEQLTRIQLHAVAISQGFSYGLLTRDLNNSNFSASRANTAEDRRKFSCDIKWFSNDCNQWVYNQFIKYLVLGGKLPYITTKILNDNFFDITQCDWHTNAWEYINPLQDVQASILERQNGLLTDETYFSEMGLDYRDVYKQLAEEKKLRIDMKLEDPELKKIQYDPNENQAA